MSEPESLYSCVLSLGLVGQALSRLYCGLYCGYQYSCSRVLVKLQIGFVLIVLFCVCDNLMTIKEGNNHAGKVVAMDYNSGGKWLFEEIGQITAPSHAPMSHICQVRGSQVDEWANWLWRPGACWKIVEPSLEHLHLSAV